MADGLVMQRTEERAWRSACNQRVPWWNAGASHMHAAFPKSWFDHLGLVSLLDTVQRLQRISRTAVCGTARTVVWEGDRDDPVPYPILLGLAPGSRLPHEQVATQMSAHSTLMSRSFATRRHLSISALTYVAN